MKLENLRALRKSRHLTQTDAARIFGVSLKSYNAWELGDYEPSLQTLIRMADYFGTTIDYIAQKEIRQITPEEKQKILEAAQILKDKL